MNVLATTDIYESTYLRMYGLQRGNWAIRRFVNPSIAQNNYLHLTRPRHHGFVFSSEHVDFGADAERLEIQARLDGESGAGQHAPIVVGFVIVEVNASTVHLFAKTVPGPMQYVIGIPGLFQHGSGGPIDL